MSEGLLISSQIRCQHCQLPFSSRQELTLHNNIAHSDKGQQVMRTLGHSDSESESSGDIISEMIHQPSWSSQDPSKVEQF